MGDMRLIFSRRPAGVGRCEVRYWLPSPAVLPVFELTVRPAAHKAGYAHKDIVGYPGLVVRCHGPSSDYEAHSQGANFAAVLSRDYIRGRLPACVSSPSNQSSPSIRRVTLDPIDGLSAAREVPIVSAL
jgi:hypothetical protein